MSYKIILFLSPIRKGAVEEDYLCPDNSIVTGAQTNEAPVKYLLKQYQDVLEILCLVTNEARASSWEVFRNTAQELAPKAKFIDIPFDDPEDISAPLHEILAHVKAGDQILLETTGGFRNTIMHLLLVSRVLSYAGIPTTAAVYSNWQEKRVQDVLPLFGMFELVGGLQELTSFGSVRTLRAYYGNSTEEAIHKLLTAAEELMDAITLCRTAAIDDKMSAFDKALQDASKCHDPLMRQLIPAFRGKFGNRLTTPGLIKWCVNSDLLQQALTVYTERIPAYILKSGRLIEKTDRARNVSTKDYEDADAMQFTRDFLLLSRKIRNGAWEPDSPRGFIETLENLEYLTKDSGYRVYCDIDQLKQICADYIYIKMLRNMTNHANTGGPEDQKLISDYLMGLGYPNPEQITSAVLRDLLLAALEHLKS